MTDIATQKSRRLRHLFEGKPSIIINHGKIDMNEMKKNRLDIDQLTGQSVTLQRYFFTSRCDICDFMKIMES